MSQASIMPATRHDGWTPQRKARFLDHLAGCGNVHAACAHAGMSREAAYRLRRRDHLFARGWAAALVLAREVSAQVLADRAIAGVEEEIYYRGELVGMRRRYDTRLLLAHLARLDRLAEDGAACADAARFEQLLAVIADAERPADLVPRGEALPLGREAYADRAEQRAEAAFRHACAEEEYAAEEDYRDDDEEEEGDPALAQEAMLAREEQCWAAASNARAEALARWDAWLTGACNALDTINAASAPGVTDAETPLATLSSLSTSPAHAAPPHPLQATYARA